MEVHLPRLLFQQAQGEADVPFWTMAVQGASKPPWPQLEVSCLYPAMVQLVVPITSHLRKLLEGEIFSGPAKLLESII